MSDADADAEILKKFAERGKNSRVNNISRASERIEGTFGQQKTSKNEGTQEKREQIDDSDLFALNYEQALSYQYNFDQFKEHITERINEHKRIYRDTILQPAGIFLFQRDDYLTPDILLSFFKDNSLDSQASALEQILKDRKKFKQIIDTTTKKLFDENGTYTKKMKSKTPPKEGDEEMEYDYNQSAAKLRLETLYSSLLAQKSKLNFDIDFDYNCIGTLLKKRFNLPVADVTEHLKDYHDNKVEIMENIEQITSLIGRIMLNPEEELSEDVKEKTLKRIWKQFKEQYVDKQTEIRVISSLYEYENFMNNFAEGVKIASTEDGYKKMLLDLFSSLGSGFQLFMRKAEEKEKAQDEKLRQASEILESP